MSMLPLRGVCVLPALPRRPRSTTPADRTGDEITLDEVERITI
jgi:hypothetical protein